MGITYVPVGSLSCGFARKCFWELAGFHFWIIMPDVNMRKTKMAIAFPQNNINREGFLGIPPFCFQEVTPMRLGGILWGLFIMGCVGTNSFFSFFVRISKRMRSDAPASSQNRKNDRTLLRCKRKRRLNKESPFIVQLFGKSELVQFLVFLDGLDNRKPNYAL